MMARQDDDKPHKDLFDNPPSPVLSNKMGLKFVHCRKMQKKSRVKLTDRFKENTAKDPLKCANTSHFLPNETLTLTQNENFLKSIEVLKREEEQQLEASQQEDGDFQFKKPESPFSGIKKLQSKLPEVSGFQTAGGKSIGVNLSDDKIQKSRKLFDDILNPGESSLENSRSNKYAFLSIKNTHISDQQVLNLHNKQEKGFLNPSCSKITPLQDQDKTACSGFKTTSGKGVQIIKETFSSALKKFDVELETNETIESEELILSSQETNDLFSDFTIREDAFSEKDEDGDFKGFVKDVVQESKKYSDEFLMVIEGFPKERHKLSIMKKKTLINVQGFATASENKNSVSNSALRKAQQNFQEIDLASEEKKISGFKKASGKKVQITESPLNIAKTKFDEFLLEDSNKTVFKQEISFLDSPETEDWFSKIPESALGKRTSSEDEFRGFHENSVKESQWKADAFFSFVEKYGDPDKTLRPDLGNELNNVTLKPVSFKSGGFSSASGNRIAISNAALEKTRENFKKTDQLNPSNESVKPSTSFETFTESRSDFSNKSTTLENISLGEVSKSNVSSRHKKKRLGISSCRPIQIPQHKLQRAANLMSPLKNDPPIIFNSTPLKNAPIHIDSEITPIKSIVAEFKCAEDSDNRIIMRECTKGTIDSWNEALENERKNLEMKLRMVVARQEALTLQKHFLENNYQDQRKRRVGVLFESKQNNEKIPLQQFLKKNFSLRTQHNIAPKNAEFVHFNYARRNISSVTTLDGACVIPNIINVIGLSEIEMAFKIVRGVEPKLIPNGWIRNHFKWIVWKLASYENFSANMKDCLSVENVIQQLKYRYDREIDKAERSTLRKIFEMDDSPQKRMVLCVSNIFDMPNGQFELELTDGWYSIRTVIDEPLCKQVGRRKIQIGTKLVTCGAELLNCEGCYPLEATDMIRLKINCNSTRRARWYAKLGYQRCPEPFPLKLNSVFSNGGLIGCIKIYIARVYPIKYMEKQNKINVWRNRRAEELRAQEWENKGQQDMEKVRETVRKSYELDLRNKRQDVKVDLNEDVIKNVVCPETLFNLYQNCKDPEKLQAILSSSQKNSIMDYQQRMLYKQQQEISRKISDSIGNSQNPKRDVTPVLQLLVTDALDPNEKTCVFQIWRPSDTHLEIIRESSVFYVYNVFPKKNGDLCTMKRTRFQVDLEKSNKFNKYKRNVLPISQVADMVNKPVFNEFDTVGIVVTISVNPCTQSLWLADSSGKLLFIKMFEGPKNCLLLDKLKSGQLVAASNLIFCQSKLQFGEAIANHLTVISSYPQPKHLQEGITALNEQLPKDFKLFLEQCNQKILYYIDKVDITKDCKNVSSKSSLVLSNSLEDSDVFDDGSDVLYSMIDVDKFA